MDKLVNHYIPELACLLIPVFRENVQLFTATYIKVYWKLKYKLILNGQTAIGLVYDYFPGIQGGASGK